MPVIHVRVSDAEKARIERRAQQAGQTVSDYIRSLGAGQQQATTPAPDDSLALRVEHLESAIAAQDRRLDALETRADAGY